jgi:hypothetical protein
VKVWRYQGGPGVRSVMGCFYSAIAATKLKILRHGSRSTAAVIPVVHHDCRHPCSAHEVDGGCARHAWQTKHCSTQAVVESATGDSRCAAPRHKLHCPALHIHFLALMPHLLPVPSDDRRGFDVPSDDRVAGGREGAQEGL